MPSLCPRAGNQYPEGQCQHVVGIVGELLQLEARESEPEQAGGQLHDEHPLPEFRSTKRSAEAVRHALVQQGLQQTVYTQ